MSRMVDDLLVASRIESTGIEITLTPTRVTKVIESAVAPFARTGTEIRWRATDAIVPTDGARLRQVLVNLLSNAVRHGGDLVGVDVSRDDGTVEIEVWDDGAGVPQDQVDRLFERFMHEGTAPLLTGSVGLGLAVASRLTSMLGGHLSYERKEGRTSFIVGLPILPEEPEELEVRGSVEPTSRALSG